ncbi:histidinol phosphate phosphatase [Fervidicella metallireducens AeB]|uniref:Histidinol-phosphatase n=1 Tax=Fervidicella metallireducens AeB TaxID=1403537 RepID=A0A017RSK7_9CLOT|nr:histidinol-phosphatase HisJ family protein [Fervidicella metallireducens]EYE87546.1 histidinol phosphate phosphatase [Fervidicella metallireducens AeB]
MNYLYDYHIHTTYSIDGHNSINEICDQAIKSGLKEIAITDHFELSSLDDNYMDFNIIGYLSEISHANELYKGKLKIKSGIELGQPHMYPDIVKKLLQCNQLDYIIGSLHKLPDSTDFSEIDYSKYTLEDICSIYLNNLKKLLTCDSFDCIGHLDLIKRYSCNHYKERVTLSLQHELLREVLKLIVLNGKGIEINTSGIRQSPRETMPGIDVLKLYRDLGGEILTIGSDSHYVEHVGKDLKIAIENAEYAGFKYLTVFNKRRPEWIKINTNTSYYINSKQIV